MKRSLKPCVYVYMCMEKQGRRKFLFLLLFGNIYGDT